MILKLVLVLGVIGIIYFIFIKKKPARKTQDVEEKKKKERLQSNDMVACASCGTYSELSETIISSNKYYCSQECVDKA